MHAVLEEVKAYNKMLEDCKPIRDMALQGSVQLLVEARDKLLECYNNTPGNFAEIQRLLQTANTYALHVEVFMSYYDIEYKAMRDKRRDAEILYKDISAYLDDVLKEEKDNLKYLTLFSYKEAAHRYFLQSMDFVFDSDVNLKKKVDIARKYIEEVKDGYISKYINDATSGS